MKLYRFVLPLALALAAPAMADDVAVPNTFSVGERAVAAEVNANFAALVAAVNALKAEVKTLQTENMDLKVKIEALEQSEVQKLAGFIEVYENPAIMPTDTGSQGPLIRFTGANVQVVSGSGSTDATPNGLGNLIVGYDEAEGSYSQCSDGEHATQSFCEAAGHIWDDVHKSGSHNVVVGRGHHYSQHSGLVAGGQNSITRIGASVTGAREIWPEGGTAV